GERERVVAATDARQPPEHVGGDAEARVYRVVAPRRHDDRAGVSDGAPQRFDHATRTLFDGTHRAIRGVHEKHVTPIDAEVAKLAGQHITERWMDSRAHRLRECDGSSRSWTPG